MAKKIFVGNLSWAATAENLLELFGKYGKVKQAQVITDREAGRSRGFGFVEMADDSEAQQAIAALNGFEHDNRPLTVNLAKQ
jgi:RNA recognition motif-containing protein